MDISIPVQIINTISTVLLTVAPAIFVFSVTLLGTAIERAQQEEKSARENDKQNLQKEIEELEVSLAKVKKDGDTKHLTQKLQELKDKQKDSDKKIESIKTKYSRINLYNSVVYPCAALFLVLLLSSVTIFFKTQTVVAIILLLPQVFLVLYSLIKIYNGLRLVEEISANKKESEMYSKVKEIIKLALSEHEQGKREEVSVEVLDKAFPLNTTISSNLDLRLRTKLVKGTVLHNVCVWFFVADGFELLDPKESSAWKQGQDYDPPNIRTVKIEVGTLSVGPYTPRTLKLKTPESPGKYLLRYKVYADGYSGSAKDLWVHVG